MKKTLYFLLLSFWSTGAFAQTKDALQFTFGRSTHGTGDLKGYALDLSLDHSISRRFDWTNGLTTTVHYGTDKGGTFTIYPPNEPPIVTSPNPKNYLRYNTTGVQMTSVLNFNVLAFPRHKLRIGVGPIFRFESSSYPRNWSYEVNSSDGIPRYAFNYEVPVNQFNVGYTFGLSYFVAITKKYQLGIKAFFQDDTDGAVIGQFGFSIGRFLQLSKLD